ncbi:MAG: hypothetical protein HKN23_11535 [Verrucomicrobiales bacterium]|nr:hypothetical protein [Verrucomicrobiales bacterium]
MTFTEFFPTDYPAEDLDTLSPDQSVLEDRVSRKEQSSGCLQPLGHNAVLDPFEELECRIGLLEVAFRNHAQELRDRVTERLERLEENLEFHSGVLSEALRKEEADRKDSFGELSTSVAAAIERVEKANCELDHLVQVAREEIEEIRG